MSASSSRDPPPPDENHDKPGPDASDQQPVKKKRRRNTWIENDIVHTLDLIDKKPAIIVEPRKFLKLSARAHLVCIL